jgi:probable O-glycosylation ligase (exosortase A-associated)
VKQTLFMLGATACGILGMLFIGPFAAVAVYYLFAVLRPQFLWQWALPTGIPWSQYVAIASIVGTTWMLLGGTSRTDTSFKLSGVQKTYLAFGAWVCITCFTAIDRQVSWPWFVEYLKIFVMFAVAAMVVRRLAQVRALYLVATCALIYIAYEVNSLYLLQGRLDIYHQGYGGLDNNGAGLMLAIGVPLAIYAWEAETRWWRWGFAASVPVLLHAVLMTYSRGAMISLIVASPLIVLRGRRRWQFAGLSLAVALVIPVLAGQEIRARFFSLNEIQADASATSRIDSWTAAVRIANEHPVAGVGVRNSNLISHEYGADVEGRTIHSQYLQILADSGYVGLLLYVCALLMLWLTIRRARRHASGLDAPNGQLLRSLLGGVEGGLAVFCIGSSFLSVEVFELPYLLAVLGGSLGIVAASEAAGRTTPATPQDGSPSPAGSVTA